MDLSLVNLDPCKVEECIRESGRVIIDKVYVCFRNRPIFDDIYETYQHKSRDTQMLHKCWERQPSHRLKHNEARVVVNYQ